MEIQHFLFLSAVLYLGAAAMVFYGARRKKKLVVQAVTVAVDPILSDLRTEKILESAEELAKQYFVKVYGNVLEKTEGKSTSEEIPEAIPLQPGEENEEHNLENGRDLSDDDDSEQRIGNENAF